MPTQASDRVEALVKKLKAEHLIPHDPYQVSRIKEHLTEFEQHSEGPDNPPPASSAVEVEPLSEAPDAA